MAKEKKEKWISVKKRYPRKFQTVLAYGEGQFWVGSRWLEDTEEKPYLAKEGGPHLYKHYIASHWMELPAKPSKEKAEGVAND